MKQSVKKSWSMVLILCMLMIVVCTCLTACSSGKGKAKSNTYTITKNNILFTVDRENQTISDGTNLYKYKADVKSGGYSIDITYPNGSTYWWNYRNCDSDFSDARVSTYELKHIKILPFT